MGNISLYNVTEEQKRINYLLEENGGEVTPEIESALAINEANLTIKAENYCATIAKYASMEEAIKAEVKRLQAYAKTCANIQEQLKGRLRDAQVAFGFDKLEVGTWRIGTRKSTKVVIDNETDIPNEYIKVATSIDKLGIAKAIKEGVEVAGAHLEENVNIAIR